MGCLSSPESNRWWVTKSVCVFWFFDLRKTDLFLKNKKECCCCSFFAVWKWVFYIVRFLYGTLTSSLYDLATGNRPHQHIPHGLGLAQAPSESLISLLFLFYIYISTCNVFCNFLSSCLKWMCIPITSLSSIYTFSFFILLVDVVAHGLIDSRRLLV